MDRYCYLCEDLDLAELATNRLADEGFDEAQVHVLSQDETGADRHASLHPVSSLMKKDILASGIKGALLGASLACLVVLASWLFGFLSTPLGPMITTFSGILMFGFCTWQGGLYGIQTNSRTTERFSEAMRQGMHVLLVDAEEPSRAKLERVLSEFPGVRATDILPGLPNWVVSGKRSVPKFLTQTLP